MLSLLIIGGGEDGEWRAVAKKSSSKLCSQVRRDKRRRERTRPVMAQAWLIAVGYPGINTLGQSSISRCARAGRWRSLPWKLEVSWIVGELHKLSNVGKHFGCHTACCVSTGHGEAGIGRWESGPRSAAPGETSKRKGREVRK